MKKKLISIILIVFITTSMTLVGCSSGGNSDIEDNVVTDQGKEEVDKEESKGKRSNPIAIGETVQWELKFYAEIDDWDGLNGLANVTLNKVYKGQEAIDMLYFGNKALEDIEDGYTYAVADMTVELIEGDDDSPYKTSFRVGSVSDEGRKSPYGYASLSDEYEENEYTDLYPGGSVDIKSPFLVPEEGGYLVEIEENISGVKFFERE